MWDLSAYDGIEVQLLKGDGKIYTLIVKDDVPERREDGREAAGVSWEFDFEVPLGKEVGAGGLGEEVGMGGGGGGGGGAGGEGEVVWMPWAGFKATYRGREFRGAKPLRTNEITRFSLMMRR